MGKQSGKKYKRFPMHRTVNGRLAVDADKLRALYLASPFYNWRKFCELHEFDPDPTKLDELPIKTWRREWIERQSEDQLHDRVDEVLEVRASVLNRRLASVKEWGQMAENLKAIYKYKVSLIGQAAQHDTVHRAMIERGDIKPKFKLSEMDGMLLSKMALQIQELDARSLLLAPKENPIQGILPTADKTPEQVNADLEAERLAQEQITIMGEGAKGLKPEQLTEMLAKWYDNHDNPEIDSIETPDIETTQPGETKALPEPSE